MSDPKRWLADAEAPDAALEMLRAIDVPVPPSLAKQTELAQRLATLIAPGAALPSAVSVWLKLGLLCSAAVGGGIWIATRISPPASPRPPEAVVIATAAIEPAPHVRAALVAEAPAGETGLDESPAPVTARKRGPNTDFLSRDALAEEERLLEEARQLSAAAPGAAWRLLERHRGRFPAGQLAAERIYLSIEVLKRLGKTDAAFARAKSLMEEFPDSVYARQLRAQSKEP
jgi:hypothetical protein